MNNLRIIITENALNFLSDKKAREITVDLITSKQCCGSGLPTSDTYIGSPRRRERDHNVFEEEGLKINIDKSLEFQDDLCTIDLVNLIFTKSLVSNFLDYNKLI